MASLDIRLSQILSDMVHLRQGHVEGAIGKAGAHSRGWKNPRTMASANIRSLLAYDLIAARLGLKPGAILKNGHIFSTSSLQFFGLGPLRSQWQVGSRRYVGRDGFMERRTSLMTAC